MDPDRLDEIVAAICSAIGFTLYQQSIQPP